MSDMSVQDKIEHYQRSLLKYSNNDERVIHCLKRLQQLPVTVKHLQITGVGRTVNALRKFPGECGDLARSLVEDWKQMVSDNRSDDEDEACVPDAPEAYKEESSPSPSRPSADEEKYVPSRIDSDQIEDQYQDDEERQDFEDEEDFEDQNFQDQKEEEPVSSSESRRSKDKRHSDKERHESRSKSHSKDEESSRKRKHEEDESRSKKHKSESKSEKSSSSKSCKSEEESRRKDKHREEKRHRSSDGKKSSLEDEKKEKHKSKKHLSSEDEKERKKSKHREESGEHKSEGSSSKPKTDSSSDVTDKKERSEKKQSDSRKTKKIKLVDPGSGIDCYSGTSFGDALGMCSSMMPAPKKRTSTQSTKSSKSETSTQAKPSTSYQSARKEEVDNAISRLMSNESLEPLSVNLAATLPEISPNYRPLPNVSAKSALTLKQEEERLLCEAMSNKNQRTKVYSGTKSKSVYKSVPTLFDLCIQKLIENIDLLDYIGPIPYYILKPVLRLATPEQLFKIEHYNPQLHPETEELWEYHCNKNFKKYCNTRGKNELWRDMYMRCIEEREAKLKGLTEGIKRKMIEKAQPVRTAKLAYVDNIVKPPRNVLRNQAKFRTGNESCNNAETKKKLLIQSATGSTSITVPGVVKQRSTAQSTAVVKKTKAPLMMKALALIKQRYKR